MAQAAEPGSALELYDWIATAADLGLMATIDDLAAAPLGVPVPVIALEYTHFHVAMLWGEDPESLGFDPRAARPPLEYFAPLRGTITRKGPLEGRGPDDPKGGHLGLRVRRALLGDECGVDVYSCGPARLAESGSGDGGTRYMLWSVLELGYMPDVFIDPDRVE